MKNYIIAFGLIGILGFLFFNYSEKSEASQNQPESQKKHASIGGPQFYKPELSFKRKSPEEISLQKLNHKELLVLLEETDSKLESSGLIDLANAGPLDEASSTKLLHLMRLKQSIYKQLIDQQLDTLGKLDI